MGEEVCVCTARVLAAWTDEVLQTPANMYILNNVFCKDQKVLHTSV